jgi:hypothetical protein
MVDLISYPFRFSRDGRVVTVEDGVDYYAEELAMLLKTVPGERELVPDYGIEDPTFNDMNKAELLEKIAMFGPPIDVETSKSNYLSDGRIAIDITYTEIPLGVDVDLGDEEYNENEYDDDFFEEEDSIYNFSEATDF